MMTFEDIVDMDWLDSHSVKGEPMELFPNDYVDFNHYLSNDLLSPKPEYVSSPPPLLMASPPPSCLMTPTMATATSCSAAAALAATVSNIPPPLTFPSTEQIKHLIELAKHQLALRISQANDSQATTTTTKNGDNNNNNNNSNNNNNNDDTNSVATDNVQTPTCSTIDTAVITSSEPSTTPSASHLAVHLANSSLFVNNANFPDTVSPEYLMKPPPTTSNTLTELSPLIKMEQDGPVPSLSRSSSPPLLISDDNNNNNTLFMDTINSSSSSSSSSLSSLSKPITTTSIPTTTSSTSSSTNKKTMTSNSRRDSLLGDDIGSLEAYAESDGIDIKKLTPKERRQLRNKISARNFRIRRKEYITTLEQQVNDHKKHADSLAEQLGRIEDENKQLRQQVDSLKRQNLLLQQQQQQQQQ